MWHSALRRCVLIFLLACLTFAGRKASATKTYSFSVGSGAYVAVVAQSDCHYITVYEEAQAGTTTIKLKAPTANDVVVTRPAGQRITLAGTYPQGSIAGYIETTTGTISVNQEEQ